MKRQTIRFGAGQGSSPCRSQIMILTAHHEMMKGMVPFSQLRRIASIMTRFTPKKKRFRRNWINKIGGKPWTSRSTD
jgi:hypothetical protein